MKLKDRLYRADISVRPSVIEGYGVFADSDIKKGDTIEECYMITSNNEIPHLGDYVFRSDVGSGIALGYGSIYNHATQPNARYELFPAKKLIRFFALEDIKANQEIFISYGANWFGSRHRKAIVPWHYHYRHLLPAIHVLWRFGILVGGFSSLFYFTNLLMT